MDKNDIVSAPQLGNVDKYYEIWKRNHFGSLSSFIEFITTPAPERDSFINSLNPHVEFYGRVAMPILQ